MNSTTREPFTLAKSKEYSDEAKALNEYAIKIEEEYAVSREKEERKKLRECVISIIAQMNELRCRVEQSIKSMSKNQ